MAKDPSAHSAAFLKALQAEDDLGRVLRAHLLIEAELWTLIRLIAHNPGVLEARSQRWGFEQIVRLAVAFGLNDAFLTPLLQLNRIRNEFAHNADRVLSEDDFNGLWGACSPFVRESALEAYGRTASKTNSALPAFEKLPIKTGLRLRWLHYAAVS